MNQRILSSDDPHYLDLSGEAHTDLSNINALQQLSVRDMTATLMYNLKYFTTKHSKEKLVGQELSFLTIWVVCDLGTTEGIQLLKNALEHMVSAVAAVKIYSYLCIMCTEITRFSLALAEGVERNSCGFHPQRRRS